LAHATLFDQAAPDRLSCGRDQATSGQITLWCGGGENGLQARIEARAEMLEGLYKVEMHTVHGSSSLWRNVNMSANTSPLEVSV
jgi:hypothetical protein